jgi:hypothetical protein
MTASNLFFQESKAMEGMLTLGSNILREISWAQMSGCSLSPVCNTNIRI